MSRELKMEFEDRNGEPDLPPYRAKKRRCNLGFRECEEEEKDEDDDEDENEDELAVLYVLDEGHRIKRKLIEGFYNGMIIRCGAYYRERWQQESRLELSRLEKSLRTYIRIDEETLWDLHELIKKSLLVDTTMAATAMGQSKSKEITVIMRIAAGLVILGGGRIAEVMQVYGVAQSTAYVIFGQFVSAVHKCRELDIVCDMSSAGCVNRAAEFAAKEKRPPIALFKYITGAVDGILIKITKPHVNQGQSYSKVHNQANYFSRKGFYALNMQGVVDANYCFTHCSIYHAGSVHDSRAYKDSGVEAFAEAQPFPFHLLGDSAYSLSEYLITPYTDGVRNQGGDRYKESFNKEHSSHRMVVEQAFGILVRKWGILWQPLTFNLPKCISVVKCCVKLHNYTQRRRQAITPCRPGAPEINKDGQLVSDQWKPLSREKRDSSGVSVVQQRILQQIINNDYVVKQNY